MWYIYNIVNWKKYYVEGGIKARYKTIINNKREKLSIALEINIMIGML